jgi:hypothetical protein
MLPIQVQCVLSLRRLVAATGAEQIREMRCATVRVPYGYLLGLAACIAALAACAESSAAPPAAKDAAELPVTSDGRLDQSGGAWRMIDVPAAGNAPRIVRTPEGWLALSGRSCCGKATISSESVLYRSRDGVAWDRIALEGDRLELSSLAYGNGHYVMVGRSKSAGVVWTSDDGVNWSESPQDLDYTNVWGRVAFVGGRFIAFGFRVLGVSDDGRSWHKVTVDLIQMMGIAHGNGRFLMAGSGPVITSEDGLHWQSQPLDCSLPNTCISDPSGISHQALLASVVFAEGRFFAGRLSSTNGVAWTVASELAPSAYAAGHFLSLAGYELSTWIAGGSPDLIATVRPTEAAVTAKGREIASVGVLDRDAPFPEHVSTAFEDGLSCATSSCVLVDGRLFLVPPPGTAPLPDRVPRNADGEPLLSDDCPVSRMIFCSDYATRTDCSCRPEAPRAPGWCPDVSQFTCEGAFAPRADEWHVDDVAEGGCSCDGSDPNQPPSFGRPCDINTAGGPRADPTICTAPLQCLPVQPPSGGFPPGPQPLICTAPCSTDTDCPTWQASGFCAGEVKLSCVSGTCQPRTCD